MLKEGSKTKLRWRELKRIYVRPPVCVIRDRIRLISRVLSWKEKQLGCTVIKRGSDTLVSCCEVQVGLCCFRVPGVGVGWWRGRLARPVRWHCSPVTGSGRPRACRSLPGWCPCWNSRASGPTGPHRPPPAPALSFHFLPLTLLFSTSGLSWAPGDLESQ